MRAAFDSAMRVRDAAKMRLPIEPLSGDEVHALVTRLFDTPPEIVKRLRDAMPKED